MNSDDVIHLIHTSWSLILSGFGVLAFWNWKEMKKTVDSKASKEDLERVLKAIERSADDASTERRIIGGQVTTLVSQVGEMRGTLSTLLMKE